MQREEATVGLERELRMRQVIASLIVGNKALRAARDPAHGTAQPAGGPGDDPLFRIELALVTETAAHVGRHHAQRALGNAELLGHLTANVMRRLRRAVKRKLLALRIDGADDRARLDRRPDQAVVDEIDRDHVRGRSQPCAHGGFVAARPAKADVAPGACVQLRRSLSLRRARVGDGGERRVVHLEALDRVDGLRQRCSDDGRHRLAHMAHGFAREREARRLGHGRAIARTHRPQRPHRRHAVSRHIGAREHRDDAGRGARGRRVNPADGRVRVRGADQRAGKRAGELDVGHETPAAGEKALIFDAPQRSANTLIVGTASLGHGG